MKKLLREVISRIPGLRFWVARVLFLGPNHNTHRFWGVFPTYAAAKKYIPKKLNRGFGAPHLKDFEEAVPERDQNTIRILSGILPDATRLFDLGGSVGMCFYQYRKQLSYRHDFTWTVCDFPLVNEEGRKLADRRLETQLLFTENRGAAEGTDIFLSNGALQYLPESPADILGSLKNRPRHVLINRVPLTERDTFFTLQHMGYSVVPYHISNLTKFTSDVEALGYKLVEVWKNDRFCDILLRPEWRVPHYYGFHFARTNG
jgi:putative methyltransferase (TIGR04325 family)